MECIQVVGLLVSILLLGLVPSCNSLCGSDYDHGVQLLFIVFRNHFHKYESEVFMGGYKYRHGAVTAHNAHVSAQNVFYMTAGWPARSR
jgi:hypothetical protein